MKFALILLSLCLALAAQARDYDFDPHNDFGTHPSHDDNKSDEPLNLKPIFEDGTIKVGYTSTFLDSHDKELILKIQTRLFAKKLSGRFNLEALPVEIVGTADLSSVSYKNTELEALKLSIAKLLLAESGVSIDAISYRFKNFRYLNMRSHVAELASVTFNEVLVTFASGRIEVVVRGNVALGVSRLETDNAAILAASEEAIRPLPEAIGFWKSARTGIALKLDKKLQLELYGGIEASSSFSDPRNFSTGYDSRYSGLSLEYELGKYFSVTTSAEFQHQEIDYRYGSSYPVDGYDEKDPFTAEISLEARY